MEDLKVILLCSSRFAFPVMQHLTYFNQLGVVVIPAHCEEMIEETKQALKTTDIPVIVTAKQDFEEQAITAIEKYAINVGLVLTFSYIIPRSVFSLPVKGFYNVHPGPLPVYRGVDPIFHQIKNREKFAGVTIHKVEEGTDTGEIVLQEKIQLLSHDTYGLLAEKLAQVAAKLVTTLTKILSMGFTAPSKPQDESKAHYYEKQSMNEFAIDWHTMDADEIIALINACNPHNKGAASKINNKIIRLLQAEKYDNDAAQPQPAGTILSIDDDSMEIAVTKGNLLKVSFIYIDEGFLTPFYLRQMGLSPGVAFENLF
jgi:methionyl-tRNA formyltransferase